MPAMRDAQGRFIASGTTPMGSGPRLVLDANLGAKLGADAATRKILLDHAKQALAGAQQAWPVHTGRGQRSLDVADIPGHAPALTTSSSMWHFVEFGTDTNPPYAPLRRGVESAGCRFKDAYGSGEP